MLERTDRIALAVFDADAAALSYAEIFDTEIVGDSTDTLAGARRVTLQWGRDQVELFQPAGDGPVAEFLETGRRGLWSGGFSSADPAALADRLERSGVVVHDQGEDRYVVLPQDLDGTGVTLTRRVEHPRVGLCDKIWQITYAVTHLHTAVDRYSALFGVEDAFTNFYHSDRFGYDGAITWFEARDGGRLDSLEYLEPTEDDAAVARFVNRNGNGIYMCSIEVDDLEQIRRRVTSTGPGWDGEGIVGFIHPRRLAGLLVGLVAYEQWNERRPLPDSAG